MQSLSPRSSNQTQTPKQSTKGKQISEQILHSNKPKQSNQRSKIHGLFVVQHQTNKSEQTNH
jgi:hypothetical protein